MLIRQCVFLLSCWEQCVLTDGVMATAAQTAEVCSCGVPVTENYKDHIVRARVWSTMESFHWGTLSGKDPLNVQSQDVSWAVQIKVWHSKLITDYTILPTVDHMSACPLIQRGQKSTLIQWQMRGGLQIWPGTTAGILNHCFNQCVPHVQKIWTHRHSSVSNLSAPHER